MDESRARQPKDFATLIAEEKRLKAVMTTHNFRAAQYEALQAQLQRLLDKEDGYRQQLAELSLRNHGLHSPCQCDPPGSGDACNAVCQILAALDAASQERPWWQEMMAAFDAAVAQVRGERMP